ncbi:MAG: PIN domain-containing protein [Deltaproteobacteria bacterium]|nr:PIN domain-containing protein [Deltaproteobacteria bacterium]
MLEASVARQPAPVVTRLLVTPDRGDHIGAADLRNECRRRGIAVTTVDALIAQLCIRHKLTLLTTDKDFARIAKKHELDIWRP